SDLPYIWFFPDIWDTYNASVADFAVADHMGDLWTYFAKNGEIPFPRAAQTMNYFEINEKITLQSSWRAEANKVYNQEFPAYVGEFPPLKMSNKSWKQIRELGAKFYKK
ncbi:hypothetical protein PENTCL1PPCAC_115, partial [Pristionchus entomophagus]